MESPPVQFYILSSNITAAYYKHVTYLILVKYSFYFKKYVVWMGCRTLECMSMVVGQDYSIKKN